MPIYEYMCLDCNNSFEELVLNSSSELKLYCSECGSERVKKLISIFGLKAEGASDPGYSASNSSGCGSCKTRNCSSCH